MQSEGGTKVVVRGFSGKEVIIGVVYALVVEAAAFVDDVVVALGASGLLRAMTDSFVLIEILAKQS